MNETKLLTAMVVLAQEYVHARRITYGGAEPEEGDLVIEVSSLRGPDPDAIGWLDGHGQAPYNYDDPTDGSVPMREVWDIRALSGYVGPGQYDQENGTARWENARFVRLPEHMANILSEEPV